MVDLSRVQTVDAARYDLSRLDPKVSSQNEFVELLVRDRHVVYDWGWDHFFVCREPFVMNYDEEMNLTKDDGRTADKERWIRCETEELHTLLIDTFVGEWGPTGADTVLRMESSGITVDLCGLEKHGPKDPQTYIENLRRELQRELATPHSVPERTRA